MLRFPDIHPVKKDAYKKIVNGFVPRTVYVSLNQDGKHTCEPIVKSGDRVEEGQKIAESGSFAVYSPIPGTVEGEELKTMPDGKINRTVRISLGGSFSFLGKKIPEADYQSFSPKALIRHIEEYGLLNTFRADRPEPLAPQLERASGYKFRLLVVRLTDEDPSRLTDTILSSVFAENVAKGIKIASYVMDAQGIVLVTEKDFKNEDAFSSLNVPCFILRTNPKQYPSAFSTHICAAVKKNTKEDLFRHISKHDLFIDASTILELYRSVSFRMPVIDRYVLVNGDCLPATGLIKVSLGTTFESVAEQCGGFVRTPDSVIVNGMVTGFSSGTLNVPVTKYVKSITFNSSRKTPWQSQALCLRCGNCRAACPLNMYPDVMYRHLTGGASAPADYMEGARYCIECGLCNAVCPSRLPINMKIQEYKNSLLNAARTEPAEEVAHVQQ